MTRVILKPLLFLALVACAVPSPGQDIGQRVAYIQEKAVMVQDVEPANEAYRDLMPLKTVLENTEVIGLGEQTHYDGSTFKAKTRLVKFLHQELGYSVIAFESGFYDCYKAWQETKDGKPALDAARKAVYPFWIAAETEELFQYIDRQKNTDHPLLMAGIDPKFSGLYAEESVVRDLAAYLRAAGSNVLADTAQWAQFTTSLGKAIKLSDYHTKPSPQDTLVLHEALSQILREITEKRRAHATSAQDDLFWQQFCRSTLVEVTRKFSGQQERDRQMAYNLSFLQQELYQGRKVMVWAASSHLAYAGENIDNEFYRQHQRLGDHLKRIYGDRYYNIGFTGYEGKIGKLLFFPLIKVKKHKKNSIEYALGQVEQPFLFLDLNRKDLPDWLQTSLIARPFGYREMGMRLPLVMDGLFYTRKIFERHALPVAPGQ